MSTKLLRTRALGVAFLLVVGGLLYLSVAIYNKDFTSSVDVTLDSDNIGHQLVVPADVKLRGIIVGEVRAVHTDGRTATLDLALQPNQVKKIPANVTAEILPKTLFGEKFVDLIIPGGESAQRTGFRAIAAGDVIKKSSTSIEAEQVFNDLVPLLNTLQPVALNMTLSNLAEALRGRGNTLGDNLARTDTYFADLNPDLPNIETDISGLADLATNLDAATPDLLASARQFAVNAQTLVAKRDAFGAFLVSANDFAHTTTTFLTANEANLVSLASVSRPSLDLLAKYSPEYSCLLKGLTAAEPSLAATFQAKPGSKPGLHIDLQTLKDQPNGYKYPADKPDYSFRKTTLAFPTCYTLPNAPARTISPVKDAQGNPTAPPLNYAQTPARYKGSPSSSSSARTNGASEVNPAADLAQAIVAPALGVPGVDVPDLAVSLLAPQLSGMAVGIS